ncbi:MAG: hypothetical protein O2794_00010 [bacterium]|nr:hypothetical protein [bacterium]
MTDGVKFDEWKPRQEPQDSGSKMAQWLLKKGMAKNQSQANIILIVAAVLFFALSIYFFL